MNGLREIREKILVNIKEVAGQNKENIIDAYYRVMKLNTLHEEKVYLLLNMRRNFYRRKILCVMKLQK